MAKNDDKIFKPQAGFQEEFVKTNVNVVFGGGILNAGKMAPLDSNVLTPKGWVKMGDIKVGDIISTPFDGNANVTAIFPQGIKDVYEITTLDGRKCECGLEHLWTIRTRKQIHKYRVGGKKWNYTMTLTTREIIEMIEKGRKVYIPTPKAIEFEKKELVIPPYALGVLLGDGSMRDMKNYNSLIISNTENDIINKFAKLVDYDRIKEPKGCYSKFIYTKHISKFKEYLSNVGLLTYSYERFIPKEYLFSSIEDRMELLKGLIDTDGSIDKKDGCVSYCTTSERMKHDFIELCRGLGYIVTIKEDKREEKYTNKKCFIISIHTDDIIFSSKKHLERYKSSHENEHKYIRSNDHVLITSIKKTRTTKCQCLLVDTPKHLYICDDYITTHNSFALVLAMAEPFLTDPDFRAVISRRSLGNQKAGGGFVEKFKQIFGKIVRIKESENPRATFPNGSFCDLTYIDCADIEKLRERAKGWEYDVMAIDELTEMTWEAFTYLMTRNRGNSKTFTGHFFATLNPKRTHWSREFLDWYIGEDGYVIPERSGKVRYFYINGDTVKDVVWGNSKREVYSQCKIDIDRKLEKVGGGYSYENMIKSFVFYQGKMSENKAMLDTNPDYIGSVAASGGKTAQALLEGNFNVDPDEEEYIPISSINAQEVFTNDPSANGDQWITADLADYGSDNMIALSWNGFHIDDILILEKSTPRENASQIKIFAQKHDVGDSHIIFDATNGRYFYDYVPDAVGYLSSTKPIGMYANTGVLMKDISYLRMVNMIKHGEITIDESVANSTYKHHNLKYTVTVQNEFMEECYVVRFDIVGNGKKRLWSKKQMNRKLGRHRSMDLLDAISMRMYPCCDLEYGKEIDEGAKEAERDRLTKSQVVTQSIYDNTLWG